jgi:hypothetical protein
VEFKVFEIQSLESSSFFKLSQSMAYLDIKKAKKLAIVSGKAYSHKPGQVALPGLGASLHFRAKPRKASISPL